MILAENPMLMLHGMSTSKRLVDKFDELKKGLRHALRKCTTRDPAEVWHHCRVVEYPWAVYVCPPKGHILDIGTNYQFSLALAGLGHEVCLHHTCQDLDAIGRLFSWEDNDTGGIRVKQAFTENREKLSVLVGTPNYMPFLADESFDTIYNISVLEHVEPENLNDWIAGTWRLLKPGGTMCVTCDYFADWGLNDGMVNHCFNHDLSKAFEKFDVKFPKELPVHPDFDANILKDESVYGFNYAGQRCVVYGFTVTKPC